MTHPDKDSQAERAALREIIEYQAPGYRSADDSDLEYVQGIAQAALDTRRAPALDAEGLPALPAPYQEAGEDAGCWFPDFYTSEQVRQSQRDAIAADRRVYEEIIRDLRIELARQDQQPARASVDTPEFRELLSDFAAEVRMQFSRDDIARARQTLIAHINAWGGVAEKT
jgi:hypothetical protein